MGIASCKKNTTEQVTTLKQLYNTYKNGEISVCQYNGQTVYSAILNGMDVPQVIYAGDGKQMGICNYGWGQVDPICKQITNCETIYRIKDNIWGKPGVDKYGLGN